MWTLGHSSPPFKVIQSELQRAVTILDGTETMAAGFLEIIRTLQPSEQDWFHASTKERKRTIGELFYLWLSKEI